MATQAHVLNARAEIAKAIALSMSEPSLREFLQDDPAALDDEGLLPILVAGPEESAWPTLRRMLAYAGDVVLTTRDGDGFIMVGMRYGRSEAEQEAHESDELRSMTVLEWVNRMRRSDDEPEAFRMSRDSIMFPSEVRESKYAPA